LERIETEHYIIRYDSNDEVRRKIAKELAAGDYLSEAYSAARGVIGQPDAGSRYQPKIKVDLLYENPGASASANVGQPFKQNLKLYVDTAVQARAGGADKLSKKALEAYGSEIAHETTHILLDRGTTWWGEAPRTGTSPDFNKKKEDSRLFLLSEGLAQRAGDLNYKYGSYHGKAKEYEDKIRSGLKKFTLTSKTWDTTGKHVVEGYPQGFFKRRARNFHITQTEAFGYFLGKAGTPKQTHQLVKLFGEGKSLDAAFRQVYGLGLDDMEKIYNEFWFKGIDPKERLSAIEKEKLAPLLGGAAIKDSQAPKEKRKEKERHIKQHEAFNQEKRRETDRQIKEREKQEMQDRLDEQRRIQEESNRRKERERLDRERRDSEKTQEERINECSQRELKYMGEHQYQWGGKERHEYEHLCDDLLPEHSR